jgi:hypothetical protein
MRIRCVVASSAQPSPAAPDGAGGQRRSSHLAPPSTSHPRLERTPPHRAAPHQGCRLGMQRLIYAACFLPGARPIKVVQIWEGKVQSTLADAA